MKNRRKIFLALCLMGWGTASLFAQSGPVASGGQATGTGGTVSYSIGQTDYITATGSGGIITEGLQQPFEIFVITGIKETNINLTASVYPNPTANFITLNIQNTKIQGMSYVLYNMQGKLIVQKTVSSNQTIINMEEQSRGIYFIKVLNNNKELKVFKIIKN